MKRWNTVGMLAVCLAGCGGGGGGGSDDGAGNVAALVPNLAAPYQIAAGPRGSSGFDLSWQVASTDQEGFKIEARQEGEEFAAVGEAPAKATTFRVKGLFPDTAYEIRVRAFGKRADGPASTPVSATTAGLEWQKLGASQPSAKARSMHSAIYDTTADRMLIYGGQDNDGILSGVWSLSSSTHYWRLMTMSSAASPDARTQHSATYDPVGNRMIVFGGLVTQDWIPMNDVWGLSLPESPSWVQIAPGGAAPGARFGHSAMYDAANRRVIVFGGMAGGYMNDVWALSLDGVPSWTQLQPSGPPPKPRKYHTSVYDPTRQQMIVFGGEDDAGRMNDVWFLSLGAFPAWTTLTLPSLPSNVEIVAIGARSGHAAIFDSFNDRMIVFGGGDFSYYPDLWAFYLTDGGYWMKQWTPLATSPSARSGASAVYDPGSQSLILFGGFNAEEGPLSDGFILPI